MASAELPPCDLVLTGGIASDIVYPKAIFELSKKYRLSHVGGTSSGAIAAALAAAAEYGRNSGGFERFAALPAEVAPKGIFSQYQPAPKLKPLFNMWTAPMGKQTCLGKKTAFFAAAVSGYIRDILIGFFAGVVTAFLIFVIVSTLASVTRNSLSIGLLWGWILFGFLLALLSAIGFFARAAWRGLSKHLPEANFGVISGKTLHGLDPAKDPAVTDWLADKIDLVAKGQVDANTPPLTFGDLKKGPDGYGKEIGIKWRPIELAMITTDLGMKRPYKLPFQDKAKQRYAHAPLASEPVEEHFFSKADFTKLFSKRVMTSLCHGKMPLKTKPGWCCPEDLYPFPEETDLPIVVATRLSFAYPLLLQQVPLYKRDFTLVAGNDEPRRCLFSDGGITSNFPIHLFDNVWPNSPTFGIAFDDFSKERHHVNGKDIRIGIAMGRQRGTLPIAPLNGIREFIERLFDVATNWQDSLQSVLPGYRERIVRVHLKPHEGGLNLKMPKPVIDALAGFGTQAGELAVSEFNMEEHRWRRFLIAMNEMEQLLEGLTKSDQAGFVTFVDGYDSQGPFAPLSPAWKEEALRRARELVSLANDWQKQPRIKSGNIPKPECDFRITPKL